MLDAYNLAGKYPKAYQLFEMSIQKFSDIALLYVYGGDTCKHLKKYEEAFQYWQKALELNHGMYAARYYS